LLKLSAELLNDMKHVLGVFGYYCGLYLLDRSIKLILLVVASLNSLLLGDTVECAADVSPTVGTFRLFLSEVKFSCCSL